MPEHDRRDEQELPPIEVNLDPLQLLIHSLEGYNLQIYGAAFEMLPPGDMILTEVTPPLKLRALDYWLRFDEEITIDHAGQQVVIRVPKIDDVVRTFEHQYIEHRTSKSRSYRAFLDRVGLRSFFRTQEPLKNLLLFSPEERVELVLLMRENHAAGLLAESLANACLKHCQRIMPSLTPGTTDWLFWQAQNVGVPRLLRTFGVEQPIVREFLDEYYWESKAFPGEEGPQIIQFLPRMPKHEPDAEEEAEKPVGEAQDNDEPVCLDEDAVRVVPIAEAGRRFAYYRTLGCKVVVRPKKVFGKEEHNYFGYMIRTMKGTWLIIVDCDAFGNAAYIFMIDPNDPFRWIIDVQNPRMVLRRIESRRHAQLEHPEEEENEEDAPTYIGREIHDEIFEQRIKRRYEND